MNLTDIAHDKLGHAVAGNIAAFLGVLLTLLPYIDSLAASHWWAAAACAAAAIGREAYNHARGGLFDWRDIAATLLGGLPVVLAVALT